MGLRNVFGKEGFKSLIVKSIAFVVFLTLMEFLCEPLANAGHLPEEFKPFSFRHMGDALLFTLALFIIYNRRKLVEIDAYKIQKRDMLFLPLSFFMLVLNYLLRINAVSNPLVWVNHLYVFIFLMSFLLLLMTVFLFNGVFGLKMTFYLWRTYRKQSIYLLLFFLGYYIMTVFIQSLWPKLSGIVAYLVYFLLTMTHTSTSINLSAENIPHLVVGNFGATIHSACSGIESMLLFISLFIIIITVDRENINFKRAAIVFFPALLGVFLLNVLRIYILFLVALHISKDLAIGIFHTNAGYIFFTVYFFVFLYFIYPWFSTKCTNRII